MRGVSLSAVQQLFKTTPMNLPRRCYTGCRKATCRLTRWTRQAQGLMVIMVPSLGSRLRRYGVVTRGRRPIEAENANKHRCRKCGQPKRQRAGADDVNMAPKRRAVEAEKAVHRKCGDSTKLFFIFFPQKMLKYSAEKASSRR